MVSVTTILYVFLIVYFVVAGSRVYLITRESLSEIAGKWTGHSGLFNVPSTMMRCIESGEESVQTGT
ncbi:hypothetical protein J5N97_008585 [Dioscorea zingiberensis]|uniref:Uncharacterized protein n=1 Tax=Dioscorea zingiberensis TaxID=325984 RepID=A0A9D5CV06_9LILI|nr:hypothetical protein J5N97_000966 [Dioscorea zingiberensis]KAJ0980330.1 hypothetical protein J5N97_008585 [Dioscorea zingiberensis]